MFRLLVAFVVSTALALPSSSQKHNRHSLQPLKIRYVQYRSKGILPAADRAETSRLLRRYVNDPTGTSKVTNPDDLREIATEYARALLQDHGFWDFWIETRLMLLSPTQSTQPVDVVFDIDEGPEFYLSDIVWTGMKELTEDELQRTMPIHPGDVASRRQIADGLDRLRKLYASKGYINFTSFPDTKIDADARTLALVINVDEGAQFRFGDLTLPGLDDGSKQMVMRRWESMRGTVYSPEKEAAFFRSVIWPAHGKLPQGSDYLFYSQFLHRRLNEKQKRIDLSIYFVPQPEEAH